MEHADLLRRMRAARRTWFELDEPPRRAVLIERPSELQMLKWRREDLTAEKLPQIILAAIVDWRGFTEADLLGAGVGGNEPVTFSPEVFVEWVADHSEIVSNLTAEVFAAIDRHAEHRGSTEKN